MTLVFSPEDERFRTEVAGWLQANLKGEFETLRGRGGPGDEAEEIFGLRQAWERRLSDGGWTCVGWPESVGGRGLSLSQQVIFNEEYVRASAPGRLGHIGETLLGPTLIAFGSEEQRARFLPGIVSAQTLWCQGYSEPNAGSDLANVQCRAVREGDDWVITGQKVWTSQAPWADWCFVLCRTDTTAPRHRGLSYLLVPMRQPGVLIRPIRQMIGSSEFAEVFFDGARTGAENVVGGENNGWKVAMGTLAFERGVSTLGQQLGFEGEFLRIVALAKENGAARDPLMRQRIAGMWVRLEILRLNALRNLSNLRDGELTREAMIMKLYWSTMHRDMGELAMDVLGAEGDRLGPNGYDLNEYQRLFLWTRCDTIYAGTNEIQRNIIGERALGLPRPPKPRGENG
jgi:alkylation response protein AidB-like acyl-CoA dehydrogenase